MHESTSFDRDFSKKFRKLKQQQNVCNSVCVLCCVFVPFRFNKTKKRISAEQGGRVKHARLPLIKKTRTRVIR